MKKPRNRVPWIFFAGARAQSVHVCQPQAQLLFSEASDPICDWNKQCFFTKCILAPEALRKEDRGTY